MAAKRLTACLGLACENRADVTIETRNMKGELIHQLDLCSRCAARPFRIVDRLIVDEREAAATKRQAERAREEQFGMPAFANALLAGAVKS